MTRVTASVVSRGTNDGGDSTHAWVALLLLVVVVVRTVASLLRWLPLLVLVLVPLKTTVLLPALCCWGSALDSAG